MRNRKRKPTSEQTTDDWEYCLHKWILPVLGDLPLASVNNKTAKPLIEKMSQGLAPKSIQNYFQVVQMVVAFLIDAETGEPLYSRKWNRDYLDIPVVRSEEQHRPSFDSGEQVTELLRTVKDIKYKVMDALMAGTGMRIGETLALEVRDLIGASMLRVCKTAYRKRVKERTKTPSGCRDLDIHPLLGRMLKSFIGNRKDGHIFGTVGTGKDKGKLSGNPGTQQNILRRSLHPALEAMGLDKRGEHAFRRFRVTHLRKQWKIGFPRDLEHYWIGHRPQHVSDLYSRLKDDVEFRQEWVVKVGLGFEIPAELLGSNTAQLDPVDPKMRLANAPLNHAA